MKQLVVQQMDLLNLHHHFRHQQQQCQIQKLFQSLRDWLFLKRTTTLTRGVASGARVGRNAPCFRNFCMKRPPLLLKILFCFEQQTEKEVFFLGLAI